VVLLEGVRRTSGFVLAAVSALAIFYVMFGPLFPGITAHRGFNFDRLLRHLLFTREGVFGPFLTQSSILIVLMALYGRLFSAVGGFKLIIQIAYFLVGRLPGGAALAAVTANVFIGAFSAFPEVNAKATGKISIPLMIKAGFSPGQSAGICAVSAAGGILSLPIMGLAAYIIPELLGISFDVFARAAIPYALSFYVCIFIAVILASIPQNISSLRKDQLPDINDALSGYLHLLIPIISLIILLMAVRPLANAIFLSLVILIAVSSLREETRLTMDKAAGALVDGMKDAIPIALACAATGLIIGVFALTGLGLMAASWFMGFAGNSVFILFAIAMLVSVVLGLILPAIAVAALSGMLIAPALVMLGVHPLPVWVFIFYCSVFSYISPIARTITDAAEIGSTDSKKASIAAWGYGALALLVPVIILTMGN